VQLKLKILWAKNFLGLSIDQIGMRHTLPMTNYYIWPKTEAWEQLKLELAFKSWVTDEEKIQILNSAAEIMNFWRVNRDLTTIETVTTRFNNINFVKINT
jgi:30S ribosomal protein 3